MQDHHAHIPSRQLDRRSVMKATAWSVPAVSLAAATPAYAASGDIGKLAVVWAGGFFTAPPRGIPGVGNTGLGTSNDPTINFRNPAYPNHAFSYDTGLPGGQVREFAITNSDTLPVKNLTVTIKTALHPQAGLTYEANFRGFGVWQLRRAGVPHIDHKAVGGFVETTYDFTHSSKPGRTINVVSEFSIGDIPAGATYTFAPRWVITKLPNNTPPIRTTSPRAPSWDVLLMVSQSTSDEVIGPARIISTAQVGGGTIPFIQPTMPVTA